MFSSRSSRAATVVAAAVAAFAFALASAAPASAVGVGDVSAAVLYEPTTPIGAILEEIDNTDDFFETVALPFAINYDGLRANALCVTTNGYVVPVATIAEGCSAEAYDASLSEGAIYTEQSTIGVLLHDIHIGNSLWAAPGADLSLYRITALEVLRITTATPHGYAIGDIVDVWFPNNDPVFGYFSSFEVTTTPSATVFTADVPGAPVVASHAVVGETRIAYNDVDDDTDLDGHADDGFGAVNQVYAGPTTVSGRPAFAVTWYRVTSYEGLNDPTLSDTFQIVIIQDATANSAVDGYNFTVYFNFGTVADNDLQDGYDATDPEFECDPGAPDNCRFAVGFSFYDALTETATSQELFASVPKADLMDGGSQALVSNSLDSGGVLGRYVLGYVGPASPAVPGPPQLAATGSDGVAPLGLAALAMLTAGGVLVLTRRGALAR